jgi:hypothetical protein
MFSAATVSLQCNGSFLENPEPGSTIPLAQLQANLFKIHMH